jgi:hypothetical protein
LDEPPVVPPCGLLSPGVPTLPVLLLLPPVLLDPLDVNGLADDDVPAHDVPPIPMPRRDGLDLIGRQRPYLPLVSPSVVERS